MDDMALLREYAAHNSEAAFETLVSRRVGFVYAAALRQVRDPHLAEEVTQAVFIILAQKAGRISGQTLLTGWLFKTTRFAALAQLRATRRRQRYESEAQMQSELQTTAPDVFWEQMSPLLDEALAALGETDRQAVLLRFFENKSLAEIGNILGTGEDSARKRVGRSIEKLHRYFHRHGISSTTAIIAGTISANSLQAAPAALAKSVMVAALAKGAAASGPTSILVKSALQLMAWAKIKTALPSILAVALATAVLAPSAVNYYQSERQWMWRVQEPTPDLVRRTPPQVKIISTKFRGTRWTYEGDGFIGIAQPLPVVIGAAYHFWRTSVISDTPLPLGRYDFIANLPGGSPEALQAEIKKQFGLVAHQETRPADVLFLRIKNSNAPGLMPSQPSSAFSERQENGEYVLTHGPIERLEGLFGVYFGKPVINQTGLNGLYDFHLKMDWNKRDAAAVKQDLLDQLGLELVPSREPIEILVVEKVK